MTETQFQKALLNKYETGFEFEGGPYEGTYQAWRDRAFAAEATNRKLRAVLEKIGNEVLSLHQYTDIIANVSKLVASIKGTQ